MNKHFQKIKKSLLSFLKDPLFLRHWEETYLSQSRRNNQLSVRVISRRKKQMYTFAGTASMFIEDMFAGIMPFMFYKGEREKYPTRLEPTSPQKERIIAEGISGRGYNRFLADSLCEFVRNTAHSLLRDGVAIYEIVYEKDVSGLIKNFELEYIDPHYLYKFFGSYYQVVLWKAAKDSQERVRITRIPPEKVLKINFPKQFGAKRKVERILRRLWILGKEIIPKFQMDAVGENRDIGFELEEFSRTKYFEVAKITKNFGWHQRITRDNYVTEYYSVIRFLRHRKFEAILRKEIIDQLNLMLNRPPFNFGVKVIMENLISVENVEAQEELLKKGDVAFTDLLKLLK